MAQFLNKTDSELQKFPTWRSNTVRHVSRETAGIRGCAPAVQTRDTTNDSSSNLSAADDRIFSVQLGKQIYFWGMEMYAGGIDTINVYYRENSSSKWRIIKGTGRLTIGAATESSDISPNLTQPSAFTPLTYPNTQLLNTDSIGTTFYPSGITTITGFGNDYSKYPYLYEMLPIGYSSAYGHLSFSGGSSTKYPTGGNFSGNTTSNDANAYPTFSQTHCRSFSFLRQGEYLIELKESTGWLGSSDNSSLYETPSKNWGTNLGSPWYQDQSTTGLNSNNKDSATNLDLMKLNPINYTSNTGLYGTLQEQLSSVTGYSQTYRSCFTKRLLIKCYASEFKDVTAGGVKKMIDCITGNTVTMPATIQLSAGTITNSSIITKPYQRVLGYGAVFEDNGSGSFINLTSPEFIDTTTNTQRFSNIEQRWNGTPKTLINRRQLIIEGLTIRGSSSLEYSKIHFNTPTGTNDTILDLRGSEFTNCTFENMIFDDTTDSVCWSGCSFKDCTFRRCQINTNSDSMMFKQCKFEGRAEGTDTLNISGNSNAFINCVFSNNYKTFFMSNDKGPCTDNLWYKCEFETCFFYSGSNQQFVSSHNKNNLLTVAPIGQPLLVKQKNREFSRNMFVFNRFFGNGIFSISTINSFSRANIYTMNDTFCPTLIKTDCNSSNNNSTTELSGGSYYDVHYYNSYRKFKMILGENTHHMRVLYNNLSEPQNFEETGGLLGLQNWSATKNEITPIFSIVSNYDNPSNGFSECKHTSKATGNKIIGNKIQNWGAAFPKKLRSPCSIYLNFYDLIHCQKCGANYYNVSDFYNTLLDFIDVHDFDGDGNADGALINVAYRNQLTMPYVGSNRGKNLGTSTYSNTTDACVGLSDSENNIGTFTHITFPEGNCKETALYFNCNSVYIGTGTTYPNPYGNEFGSHGKQGNNNYRRISVPTFINSATPVTIVTNTSSSTIYTGDIFNRLQQR